MAYTRWVLLLSIALAGRARAQTMPPAEENSTSLPSTPVLSLADAEMLPDSPGTVQLEQRLEQTQSGSAIRQKLPPCPPPRPHSGADPRAASELESQPPCEKQNLYRFYLNSSAPYPLTPRQKGYLAFRDLIDPFNLLTVALNSGFTTVINAHNAYGPGLKGFGRNVGYTLSQDATGEFIGTFAVCSLFHEDPHYHRLPEGRPVQRVLHALSRTVISQHDDGHRMPNYEVFLTYPASAEIGNLYVPGVHGNAPSTVERIATGLATDPVNNLITEFLPDIARRIHVRVLFVQQIVNQVAAGQT